MTFDPSIANGQTIMDILQIQATLAGYSLVDADNVEIEPGSGLEVDVTFNTDARLAGPAESIDNVTGHSLPDADEDNPRKALLYLDDDGNVQSIGGNAAEARPEGEERARSGIPDVPIPSEPFLPLAEVWIEENASDISSGDILTRRMPFEQGEGSGLNADFLDGRDDYYSPDDGGLGSGMDADTVRGFEPRSLISPIYGDGSDGDLSFEDETIDRWIEGREVEISGTTDVDDFTIIRATSKITVSGTINATGAGGDGGEAMEDEAQDGEPGQPSMFVPIGEGGSGGRGGHSSGSGGNGGDGDMSAPDEDDVVETVFNRRDRLRPTYIHDFFNSEEYNDTSPTPTLGGAGGGSGGTGDGGDSDGDGNDGDFPGGGGGGGSRDGGGSNDSGAGGDGGGYIYMSAPEIEITGDIEANGTDGGSPPSSDFSAPGGGGGGGSGGLIAIFGGDVEITGSLEAEAGKGGEGAEQTSETYPEAGDGADGAEGDIITITNSYNND